MPNIIDSTVVASAYTTSASARPQRLSNGWIVSEIYDVPNNRLRFYVSKDNENTNTELCFINVPAVNSFSLASKGNLIYGFVVPSNAQYAWFFKIDATTQTDTDIGSTLVIVESGQTAFKGCSLAINSTGTELQASWSSKNATYANSFNIRYAKGTIASDGGVTWGTVQQLTTDNTTGVDSTLPCIISCNSQICILYSFNYLTTTNGIRSLTFTSIWVMKNPYISNGYPQSSPDAIFVPQSINGLANGRIWVACYGTDATDTTVGNIRVSYSDDLGVTWSAMQKLTSGNTIYKMNPSITTNKNNEIFILATSSNGDNGLAFIKNTNNIWGAWTVTKTGVTSTNPSTLYDPNFNFTEPLFIYKDTAKVGFYGSWTVTTISVMQGALGSKSDKANLLTYAITTDGTMGTITESVNGVVVGTKTLASGVNGIVGLSQAQWDAIKYGKYKDGIGGLNTLTITMGTDTFTYTFDKRLATTDDITSAMKAVQDSQSVMLPSVKAKLGSAIRSKGGSVLDSAIFEDMASAVNNIIIPTIASLGGKNYASGTVMYDQNSNYNFIVSGLTFTPKYISFNIPSKVYFESAVISGTNPNGIYLGSLTNVTPGRFDFSVWSSSGYPTGVVKWYATD